MPCPSCAAETASGQLYCTHCGAGLAPLPIHPVPPFAPSAPAPPTSKIPQPLRLALVTLLILAAIIFDFLATARRYHGNLSGEGSGYWIGSMLLPALVAWLIAGVKKRRNALAFAAWFFGITLISSAPTFFPRHHGLTDLPGPEMTREIMGITPLPADASEDDKQTVAITKGIFADLRTINDDYQRQQAQLTPDLNTLDAASTFATQAAMQHARAVVAQKLALDQQTSLKLQNISALCRASLKQSSLSPAEQEDFIRGFETQFTSSSVMQARQQMLAAETSWAAATTDLYDFALQHIPQIKVSGASIHIVGPDLTAQFNTRFHRAEELRTTFNAAVRNMAHIRQSMLTAQGLTADETGLKQPSTP